MVRDAVIDDLGRPLVLVVDDDVDLARFVEINLRLAGFDVVAAEDGLDALVKIEHDRPDIVLLDVMMPRIDGVALLRQLRADPGTVSLPVIMLTAKSLSVDKVVALTAGADDYIIKPFDTVELIARVRSTLRRNREIRAVSPLTGLPGNNSILAEIASRIAGGAAYAVCYVDLDNFKSYNDRYGFVRGDQVLGRVASALRRAVSQAGAPTPFLGHIGGDDFLVVCEPWQAEPFADRVVEIVDGEIPALYDEEDRRRGYLELPDRRGARQRFPLVAVSIGVVLSSTRAFQDHREVVAVATEMKGVAKREIGSAVAVDRRSVG